MDTFERKAYDSFFVLVNDEPTGPYTLDQLLAMENPYELIVSPVGEDQVIWDTLGTFDTGSYTPAQKPAQQPVAATASLQKEAANVKEMGPVEHTWSITLTGLTPEELDQFSKLPYDTELADHVKVKAALSVSPELNYLHIMAHAALSADEVKALALEFLSKNGITVAANAKNLTIQKKADRTFEKIPGGYRVVDYAESFYDNTVENASPSERVTRQVSKYKEVWRGDHPSEYADGLGEVELVYGKGNDLLNLDSEVLSQVNTDGDVTYFRRMLMLQDGKWVDTKLTDDATEHAAQLDEVRDDSAVHIDQMAQEGMEPAVKSEATLKSFIQKKSSFYGGFVRKNAQTVDFFGTKVSFDSVDYDPTK